MASETPPPPPVVPHTYLGRWIADAKLLLGKHSGRRAADKAPRKASVVIALLLILELVIRLGWRIIDSQFQAYNAQVTVAASRASEDRRRFEDRSLQVQERTAAAMEGMAAAQKDTNNTLARFMWERETKPQTKRGGK